MLLKVNYVVVDRFGTAQTLFDNYLEAYNLELNWAFKYKEGHGVPKLKSIELGEVLGQMDPVA